MGLFEEPDTTGDDERDITPGEFHLQFERMEVRSVQDADFVERNPFIAQFEGALGDEGGLFPRIGGDDECGLLP